MDWLKAVAGAVAMAFITIASAVIKHLWNRQRAQTIRQTAIENGLQALLHDRIFSIYAECRDKKFATVDDIRNLDYLYQPYRALGGNGTGQELYERVKKMPDKPAEQEA